MEAWHDNQYAMFTIPVEAEPEAPPLERVPPTQVQHPWRATARTIFAFITGAVVAGSVGLPIIADAFGMYLPPKFVAFLLTLAGFCATVTAAATRLMAVPQVNEFLSRFKLGASK